MSELQTAIDRVLREPGPAITYALSRAFAQHFAGSFVLETTDRVDELSRFAATGQCELEECPEVHLLRNAKWNAGDTPLKYKRQLSLRRARWEGHTLSILYVEAELPAFSIERTLIAGADRATVERFFHSYRAWSSEVRDEVLVYDQQDWMRDEVLFASIQQASIEQLILPDALLRTLVSDLERFFASRELYRSMGVPWKRGVLLLGPPGNGKTHTIRALARHLRVPVLYVKSFGGGQDPHEGVREVFRRARLSPGCLLVMEDLDSLITDLNRSFFLNELDGFASNDGLCIVATTNHPEQLDPAIIERPSRFDRKYHFTLPAAPERERYVRQWFAQRAAEARPADETLVKVAAECEGFSFAYLKELCMSSVMQWIDAPGAQSPDEALRAQLKLLRAQMSSRRVAGLVHPESRR